MHTDIPLRHLGQFPSVTTSDLEHSHMKHKTKQTLSEILRPQTELHINYSGVNKNRSPRMSRLRSSNFAGSPF
jgi:hypothetical protein